MDENANSENNGACSEYLFMRGYNCAQAVFAAHATKLGMDFDTALKVSAPLGGGVGRMREVCGAFSACAMLDGLISPAPDERDANYYATRPCAKIVENASEIVEKYILK